MSKPAIKSRTATLKPDSMNFRITILLAAPILFLSLAHAAGYSPDKLLQSITQRFGTPSAQKFHDWRDIVTGTKSMADPDEQIKKVNDFWNRQMQFTEDMDAWKQSDYWATPMESLGHGKGDCEDFAIAKYFTLLSAGMDMSQLRLIYVKARMGGSASNITQAHMVLAYYSDPDAEPQILDNLLGEIRPASRRQDLTPVFSFNSQGIWAGVSASGSAKSTSTKRLSRWEELLSRARAEGFE